MSWWVITVTETRDVVTRLAIGCERPARWAYEDLLARKAKARWLAVSLAQADAPPVRGREEKSRALKLLYS